MGNSSRQRESDTAQVAVCASDEELRQRLEATLVLGGHAVLSSAASVHELIESTQAVMPSLVVLASEVGPFGLARDVAALRAVLGGTPIVFVAVGPLSRTARKLVRKDLDGFLHERDIERALIPTANAVRGGQLCIPAALRTILARPVFTHREKQVLELVVAGLTNGEIAAQLYLSESTVKSHLAASFRKLGVSSRIEAAQRALDPESGIELASSAPPAVAADPAGALR